MNEQEKEKPEKERKPLTLQELKEMAGKPVYCPDADGYGIVKCETKGHWAGIPFLIGAWHEGGVAVNFEYNIKKRKLKCYRIEQVEALEALEKQKPKTPDIWGDGYSDGQLVYDMWDCPNCGESYEIDYHDYKYCPNCGQRIDRRAIHEETE